MSLRPITSIVASLFIAGSVFAQTTPPSGRRLATPSTKPQQEQPKTEPGRGIATPKKFKSNVVLIVDAPPPLRKRLTDALKAGFGTLDGVNVQVFDQGWKTTPNWTISVSMTSKGEGEGESFVMAFAFSKALSLVDGDVVEREIDQRTTAVPKEIVKQLMQRHRIGISEFKAMWIAQGNVKDDLEGSCKEAASIFDNQFLAPERRSHAMRRFDESREKAPQSDRTQ